MKSPVAGIAALFVLLVVLIVGYSSVFTVTRPSRRWWCGSASRSRGHRAGAAFQGAVHRYRDRHRQAHPRSGKSVAGSHRLDQKRLVVDAFARYRIKDAAAVLSERRLDPGRQHPVDDAAERGAAPRARRGHLHPGGARRARSPDGARSATSSTRKPAATASRWSTCGSGAPICRSRTARRSISACRPSGSAKPPSSAPKGGQKAQEIRSNADREATVIVAEANSTAEQVRGDGDGERNRLFAEAYGKDPDFFAFYRSMTAYENG
jgi:membrane protease subunit HflC